MSIPIGGIPGIPMNAGITGLDSSIPKITAPVRPGQGEEASPAALDGIRESGFGSLFRGMIQDVKDTDAEFTRAQYLLSTGQLDNPVQVNLAASKAELSLSLLIEMRNRALEAYSELKNMNI